MTAFFIYLLKVSFWITIWWLIYHFFFRKETFHIFNRIYLMTGLVASILLSLMKISYPVEIFITQTSTATVVENVYSSVNQYNIYLVLFYLYLFCGAFFITRQLYFLLKIHQQIRVAGYTIDDKCCLVHLTGIKTPFSFYNYIFLDFRQTPEGERQFILAHERSHITQRHWIDLAAAESICIFLWFNPFAWLYLRSVRENHEYLADDSVIRNGYSPVYYRAALINQSLNVPVFPLVNPFASYQFKRISMMKKETSNPLKKLAVLLLIPALCFFFWAFSEPEYRVKTVGLPQQPSIELLVESVTETVELSNVTPQQHVTPQPAAAVVKDSVKVETVAGASTAPLIFVDGKESPFSSVNELDSEGIESINILKDASAISRYGERGRNGVMLITTKKTSVPAENSTVDAGQSQTAHVRGAGIPTAEPTTHKILFIVDGEEVSPDYINQLSPKRIESVSVFKDESAIRFYGERGKDGVVIITTNK
jgi:TonB-dependent SusC/RagA subfamily outer membrane receptor